VNKAQLVETLAERLGGDKKSAAAAVDAFVDTVIRSVAKGEKVSITGFGVYEKRVRAARTARNPATGATVRLKRTSVPAFRAGQGFKDVVSGAKKVAKAPAKSTTKATARKSAAKKAGTKTTARKAATRSTATKKATTARKTTAKKAGAAKKTTAKRTTAAKRTARR
jgi:DNA-binding protein HU-beta